MKKTRRQISKAKYQARKTGDRRMVAYTTLYDHKGTTATLFWWSQFLKVPVKTLNNRVKRCGVSALLTEKGFREKQRLEKNRAQAKRRKVAK